MKIILIFFVALLAFTESTAQNRNSKWCFGDSAGIDFSNLQNPMPFKTSVKGRGSCVSMCDTLGQLQFYAYTRATVPGKTTLIKNKFDTLMLNGNNIIGEGWYQELIVIPFPIYNQNFYLFSAGLNDFYGLYYSTIDMTLDNGNGAVMQKNIQLQSEPANDGLVAMKHGNGRDWWVIHRRNGAWGAGIDNTFFKYLVTPAGVALNDSQNIGSFVGSNLIKYAFNKQGNKLAMCAWTGVIETFDFDRCTGQLTNHVLVHQKDPNNSYSEFFSCEWSASGRFLYVSTAGAYDSTYVIQIDMLNPQLFNASDTVGIISYPIAAGGIMKRAPDDKIYFSCSWYDGTFNFPYPDTTYNMYNMNLSVINSPDSLGAACNFTPFSFYLGGSRTYYGLPNNPDYDMGPDTGSVCDSLGLFLTPALSKGEGVMQITYISAWEKLFLNAQNLKGKNVTVSIYDGRGSLKFEVISLKSNAGYFTLDVDCAGWSAGLYVVHLQTEKEILSKKFIKE